MKKLLKITASMLLLFNGTGAIYGGMNLILYPDGSSIQLSPDWLKYTYFDDYLIPGIVLFIANGIFSIVVFVSVLINQKNYPWLVMAQGAILTGWIFIQILLIQTIYFLHIILGAIGVLLIMIGFLLRKQSFKNTLESHKPKQ